jgi:hypothetical protein
MWESRGTVNAIETGKHDPRLLQFWGFDSYQREVRDLPRTAISFRNAPIICVQLKRNWSRHLTLTPHESRHQLLAPPLA